jgi:hypothetical protein
MDRATLEAAMSSLPQRTFLMRNVHDDAPVLLRTRWAMSYLRGPLTTAEISRLTAATAAAPGPAASAPETSSLPPQRSVTGSGAAAARPVMPAGVHEYFLATTAPDVTYEPCIGARVRAHFVDARAGMDAWEHWYYLAPLGSTGPDWEAAVTCNAEAIELRDAPAPGARFADVPGNALNAKAHAQFARSLADHVYRAAAVTVYRCPSLKANAAPGGSEADFRAHLGQLLREKRDAAVDTLRRKYATRLTALADRQRRAEQKVAAEKEQASSTTMASALSVGGSLLGALFGGGRRASSLGRAASAARGVSRIGKERTDVAHAEADLAALRERYEALETELEQEVAALETSLDPATIAIESAAIKPRKSDIEVSDVALVWRPA